MSGLWVPPPHWPVIQPGLLMTGIDDVMFVCLDEHAPPSAHEAHLSELARTIDARVPGSRIGVLYDQGAPIGGDAKLRARLATVLRERRELLARTTAAYTLASSSPVLRGIVRAVFWLEPPPYPWSVVADLPSALEYLAKHMTKLEPRRTLARYEQWKAKARVDARFRAPDGSGRVSRDA